MLPSDEGVDHMPAMVTGQLFLIKLKSKWMKQELLLVDLILNCMVLLFWIMVVQ